MATTELAGRLQTVQAAQRAGQQPRDILSLVERMKPEMARALPKALDPDRFTRIAITSLRLNPKLMACRQESLLGALMLSAQLGLEPGGPLGHAYLVPYGQELTFIVGYKGYIALARRSEQISQIYAHAVKEGDLFRYALGLEPSLVHEPKMDGDATRPITHVYAVARFKDGTEPQFVVLTRSQVDSYRARSKAADSGPWVTDYEAMALKTGVRRLATWLPLTTEMAAAAAMDEQVVHGAVDITDVALEAPGAVEDGVVEQPSAESQKAAEEATAAGKAASKTEPAELPLAGDQEEEE